MKTIEQLLSEQRQPRQNHEERFPCLSPHAIMTKKIDEGLKEVGRKTFLTYSKAQERKNTENGTAGTVEFFQ